MISSDSWDDLPSWQQASLLSYDMIRQLEEIDMMQAMVPQLGI